MRCKNCFLRNNIAILSVFIAIRSRCFVSSEYAEFPTTTTEKQHKQLWSDLFSYVQDFNVCRRFIINRFVIYLCIDVLRARALFVEIIKFIVITPFKHCSQ